jgi:hypothetical protein
MNNKTLHSSFYEVGFIRISKPLKSIKNKATDQYFCEYRCKYTHHNTGIATYKSYTP